MNLLQKFSLAVSVYVCNLLLSLINDRSLLKFVKWENMPGKSTIMMQNDDLKVRIG